MKKIFFSAIICTTFFCFANAQLGITAGSNLSEYKYSSDRLPVFTFNAGLFYKIGSKNSLLAVQPSLIYTGKGAIKSTDIDINSNVNRYINHINYVEFNMPFMLSIPVVDDNFIKADFGAGPYAAYVVHAASTAETYDGVKTTTDFKVGSSGTDDFKPFDAGLSFFVGLEFSKLSFNFQYDTGITNANPRANDAPLKMRAAMFNVAIRFGK